MNIKDLLLAVFCPASHLHQSLVPHSSSLLAPIIVTMMLPTALTALALLAAEAAAHGAVTSYVIAGKNYPGLVINTVCLVVPTQLSHSTDTRAFLPLPLPLSSASGPTTTP